MIEKYKAQIAQNENFEDIAELLVSDPLFKKRVEKYFVSPYDSAPYLKGLNMPPISFARKGETLYLAGAKENGKVSAETEATIAKSIRNGLLTSIHLISPDGLFLTLLESSLINRLGFDITSDSDMEEKEFLFGESRYVAIVSVDEDHENDLADLFFNNNSQLILLGHVTKGELRMDDFSFGYSKDYLPE